MLVPLVAFPVAARAATLRTTIVAAFPSRNAGWGVISRLASGTGRNSTENSARYPATSDPTVAVPASSGDTSSREMHRSDPNGTSRVDGVSAAAPNHLPRVVVSLV